MIKAERIEKIFKILEDEGIVNIQDLSKRFGVTSMTIRRDLEELQSRNCVCRTHGGAIFQEQKNDNAGIPSLDRMRLMKKEKILVAKKAAQLINSGDVVFLGSGTTTLYLAEQIASRDDITILTNSLVILNKLAISGNMTLIGIGGILRKSEFSMIGHYANDMIRDLFIDKLFMGMKGIHSRFGLTSNHPQELLTDQTLIEASNKVMIIADHTKIGHVAASRTTTIESASAIITTKQASREIVRAIEERGVEVIFA